VDPHAERPQSTLTRVHKFELDSGAEIPDQDGRHGSYGSGMSGEAIVEDPSNPDLFYTFSGVHGRAGTWCVYRLDLRNFDPASPPSTVAVERIASVPEVVWLNGGTMLPQTRTLIMAESYQGKFVACDVDTGAISTWHQHEWLGKMTTRPPWPAANGVQYYDRSVYVTNSDRAILLRIKVDEPAGVAVEDSIEILASGVAGDDLAFDVEGSAYVATNPMQTVLKFEQVARRGARVSGEEGQRFIVLGGKDNTETTGPTAVAFGRTKDDQDKLYVVTTGGLIVPVGDGPSEARVLTVDVGIAGAVSQDS